MPEKIPAVNHAFAPHAYVIKHDLERETHRFTALGPGGRIGGDVNTQNEARTAILERAGAEDCTYGAIREEPWGSWWPVVPTPKPQPGACPMPDTKKTPFEWEREPWCERTVFDPDGWRVDGTSLETPITRAEYERRALMSSTMLRKRET